MKQIAARQVGEFEVVVMKDGGTEWDYSVFPDVEESRLTELLAAAGKKVIETNFHAVLLRSKDQCILIDAGARDLFGANAGQLPGAMREARLQPEDVQILVVTHLHPDHIGGMITEDGTPVFPNAELVVTNSEYEFWRNENNFVTAADDVRKWKSIADSVLDAYGERVRTSRPTDDIAPHVSFVDLPGHTVGHAGVRLDSAGEQFIHAADILHCQDIQLADPGISFVLDFDPTLAERSRRWVLGWVVSEGVLFSGAHCLDCPLGYVESWGSGYRWIKEGWE